MRRAKGRVLGFLWSESQKGQDSPQRLRPRLEPFHSLRLRDLLCENCLGEVLRWSADWGKAIRDLAFPAGGARKLH